MDAKPKDELLVAIDALAVELGIGNDGLAFTWDQLECINRILAVHAHELAERQRVYAWGRRQSFQDEHAGGAVAAADLIDPEVMS